MEESIGTLSLFAWGGDQLIHPRMPPKATRTIDHCSCPPHEPLTAPLTAPLAAPLTVHADAPTHAEVLPTAGPF
jgi:hypothetical protein